MPHSRSQSPKRSRGSNKEETLDLPYPVGVILEAYTELFDKPENELHIHMAKKLRFKSKKISRLLCYVHANPNRYVSAHSDTEILAMCLFIRLDMDKRMTHSLIDTGPDRNYVFRYGAFISGAMCFTIGNMWFSDGLDKHEKKFELKKKEDFLLAAKWFLLELFENVQVHKYLKYLSDYTYETDILTMKFVVSSINANYVCRAIELIPRDEDTARVKILKKVENPIEKKVTFSLKFNYYGNYSSDEDSD